MGSKQELLLSAAVNRRRTGQEPFSSTEGIGAISTGARDTGWLALGLAQYQTAKQQNPLGWGGGKDGLIIPLGAASEAAGLAAH